ncbi:phage tail protein [Rodentibacter pneumotropicus]|uniref:Phage tail protein n=1 Tax=Rodentibacter pneumotropicus TaxID=758 RepID=A0AAW5LAX2_9PAST|nr:phage tail protein [Rodentibacter pneumotropicus]MCQ9121200.1 phage tail protein [Rodentibacter pneumotropicus]NBH76186.1 phage tail protein [Rodentibacter pneumotropicus]OOF66568.1 phage tail protein [Rodentibacter pneumotropicus]THA08356.1 phage tail protein [Rodentibacter pneumotropicus]THA12578.1 phage tail protein [Rodentibacter pneumotropicus]
MEKYAGSAVLEVDGIEIEITDLNITKQTGRKLVKTMNSEGRARGFAQGIATWEIALTAALPIDGSEIDWVAIRDAKITIYPLNQEDKRTSYLGCFTTQVGEKYTVDNEAVIDIQMNALKEVKE